MTLWYEDDLIEIRHGDSRTVLLDVMREHVGRPMVLVTDPPYGYAYASNKPGSKFKGQQILNDADLTHRDAILDIWGDGRPALVFGSWKRPRPERTKNVIVWDKGDNPGMGDLSMPWGSSHEEIYVLGPTDLWTGKRGRSVLRHERITHGPSCPMLHPNEKPVPLMRDLIEKVCPTAVIIDPFMGSGATLRAAKDLGRRAIGIELDDQWLTVARDRLSQESLFVGV